MALNQQELWRQLREAERLTLPAREAPRRRGIRRLVRLAFAAVR